MVHSSTLSLTFILYDMVYLHMLYFYWTYDKKEPIWVMLMGLIRYPSLSYIYILYIEESLSLFARDIKVTKGEEDQIHMRSFYHLPSCSISNHAIKKVLSTFTSILIFTKFINLFYHVFLTSGTKLLQMDLESSPYHS